MTRTTETLMTPNPKEWQIYYVTTSGENQQEVFMYDREFAVALFESLDLADKLEILDMMWGLAKEDAE